MQVEWYGSPNFRKGRNGRQPIAIADHITAGAFPGCLTWMQNPASQASAQYLVTKQGRIIQLVKDEDTAWHAGVVNKPSWPLYDGTNPNYYTIGIEHGRSDRGTVPGHIMAAPADYCTVGDTGRPGPCNRPLPD